MVYVFFMGTDLTHVLARPAASPQKRFGRLMDVFTHRERDGKWWVVAQYGSTYVHFGPFLAKRKAQLFSKRVE